MLLVWVEMISVGHASFLVEVDLMWVQDPGPSPKTSRRHPTNTLNIGYRTKVAQNKITIHIIFLEKKKKKTIIVAHANSLWGIKRAMQTNVATLFLTMKISAGSKKIIMALYN